LMVEDLLLVDQLLVEGGKEVESKVAKWIFNDDDSWRGKILMMGQLLLFCTQLLFSSDCESNLSIYGVLMSWIPCLVMYNWHYDCLISPTSFVNLWLCHVIKRSLDFAFPSSLHLGQWHNY
jgi:hypothetical protein